MNHYSMLLLSVFQLFAFTASVFYLTSLPAQENSTAERNEKIARRAEEIAPFLSSTPRCVGRPISDRQAWQALAEQKGFQTIVALAEIQAMAPIPELPELLYKEFFENGNRSNFQNARFQKYDRICILVLAECLENQGRFLKPLEETIRSVCNDASWVLPAHDHDTIIRDGEQIRRNAPVYDGKTVYIDLDSAGTSVELGLAVRWLGEKLSPEIRELILENVRRRTFEPYEQSILSGKLGRNTWITTTNNWNSVCHAGVVGAALALIDSPQKRAWYIAASEMFMGPFFEGFTPDGYCSEGMSYWSYGFGNFVELAEMVWQATDGKVDFLSMPMVRPCSVFAPKMEVTPGLFAAFADCPINARPNLLVLKYLNRRLQFGFEAYEKVGLVPGMLKSVGAFCLPNSATAMPAAKPATLPVETLRTEFPDAGVLICRPRKSDDLRQLALACKGGHNQELHNHNDVGSFTVVYAGTLPVLDPGGEVYTRRTFSNRRYESRLLNSFGHPVPMINGELQKTGRQAAGKVTQRSFSEEKDLFVIDLSAAYGLKELKKLERAFEFRRSPPGTPNSITVTDQVEFDSTGQFETALLTYGEWEKKEGNGDDGIIELLIGEKDKRIRILVEATDRDKALPLEFETCLIEEDSMVQKMPVRFALKVKEPISAAKVTIRIEPL